MEASEGISPKPPAISHCQHCILNNITKKSAYKEKKNQEGRGELVSSAVEGLKKKKKERKTHYSQRLYLTN